LISNLVIDPKLITIIRKITIITIMKTIPIKTRKKNTFKFTYCELVLVIGIVWKQTSLKGDKIFIFE
jgi:hypothetical protein